MVTWKVCDNASCLNFPPRPLGHRASGGGGCSRRVGDVMTYAAIGLVIVGLLILFGRIITDLFRDRD